MYASINQSTTIQEWLKKKLKITICHKDWLPTNPSIHNHKHTVSLCYTLLIPPSPSLLEKKQNARKQVLPNKEGGGRKMQKRNPPAKNKNITRCHVFNPVSPTASKQTIKFALQGVKPAVSGRQVMSYLFSFSLSLSLRYFKQEAEKREKEERGACSK